jgi:hypothetical protein
MKRAAAHRYATQWHDTRQASVITLLGVRLRGFVKLNVLVEGSTLLGAMR